LRNALGETDQLFEGALLKALSGLPVHGTEAPLEEPQHDLEEALPSLLERTGLESTPAPLSGPAGASPGVIDRR